MTKGQFADTEITEELPRSTAIFDAERFVGERRFRAELEAVFGTQWIHACRVSELPPRGAIERTVAGRPVALTRDGDDIRAVHNVCSHRGCAVVEGTVDGDRLRCPFHGWTYGLDGRVRAVPGRHRFADLDLDDCALPRAHTAVWGGGVWVNFATDPVPFEAWLGPWAGELARYRMEEQRVYRGRVDEVEVNWKAAVDSFNETYHVPFIHADTVGRLVHGKASTFRYSGVHSRMVVPVKRSPEKGPRPAAPRRKDLLPEQARDHVNYTLFPNLLVNMVATWGIVIVFDPVAVDRTLMRTQMLADPVANEDGLAAQWRQFTKVLEEDLATLARIAAGFGSPAFSRIRLGGEEERLMHFHRTVDALLAEAGS